MPNPPYRVLLADYRNSDISAEIPFLFKEAGCIVDVYCSPGSWLLKNRYRDAWHAADTEDPEGYANGLIALSKENPYDWVVLTDDEAIRAMNDHIDDVEVARKILPVSRPENRALLGSKAALSLLCQGSGLRTPPFLVYRDEKDIGLAGTLVTFPLLAKVDRSGGGKGIFFCANEAELGKVMQGLPDGKKKDLVLQKYLAGDCIGVEALYRDGALLAYAYSKVTRTLAGEFGVSSVRRYSAQPELVPCFARIGEALGIDGFCSFTFIRETGTDEHHLIEADLRPHGWFSLARFAGVDFPAAIRAYLSPAGGSIREPLPAPAGEAEIRHFSRDIRWAIDRLDLREIMRWCFNADGRWKFIPLHDGKLLRSSLSLLARDYAYRLAAVRRRLGFAGRA